MNAEKTIILLPSLPGVDELCAALMIACADKANTTIYTGQKSYPKLYHEFLQPDGVKFLSRQDINKQIELSLKLSPEDSTVKNIRWDSDQSELKIFVELEERSGTTTNNVNNDDKGIESLEAATITAKQVGFDHILSFASSAEEIEDYPVLRDSGRLFGGKLVKLVAQNPVTSGYGYLMTRSTDDKATLDAASSRYYEIGQKYFNSYKTSGSSLFTSSQGKLYRTIGRQAQILLDFWSGKLELDNEEQIWDLFALIMLTPSFNPLIQQEGASSFAAVARAGNLELLAAKSSGNEKNKQVILQRDYQEFSIVVSEIGGDVDSGRNLVNSSNEGNIQPRQNEPRKTVPVKKDSRRGQDLVQDKRRRIKQGSKQRPYKPAPQKNFPKPENSSVTKKADYIPLAPAKSND